MNLAESVVEEQTDARRMARTLVQRMREQGENRHARFAVWCGIGMSLVLAGTLFGGKVVALASMGVLVAALSVMAIRWPYPAISFLFIYLAMEGMYKYLTGFSKIVYTARPLLLLVLAAFWFFGYHGRRTVTSSAFGAITIPALLGWGALCVFHPYGGPVVAGFATYLLFYASPVCLYYVVSRGNVTRGDLILILYLLLSVSTVVSGFTVVQYVKGLEWTIAHLPGYELMPLDQATWFMYDEAGNFSGGLRPASTTSSAGGGATWSSLGVITGFGLLHLAVPGRRRVVIQLAVLVCGLGLLLSGVRIWSFITLAGVLLFTLIVGRRVMGFARSFGLLVGFSVVTAVAFGAALFISEGAVQKRYADTFKNPVGRYKAERAGNLVVFAKLAWNYPLGSGYHMPLGYQGVAMRDAGLSDPVMQARTGETQFGAITGDMGIPGLLLLAGLYLSSVAMGWRTVDRLRDPTLKIIGAIMFATIASYLPGWFGGPIMQGNLLFWFAAGVLLALPGLEWREQQELKTLTTRVQERLSAANSS
jgi:hypothetical protein